MQIRVGRQRVEPFSFVLIVLFVWLFTTITGLVLITWALAQVAFSLFCLPSLLMRRKGRA